MSISPLLPGEVNKVLHLQPPQWSDIEPKFQFYAQSPFSFPVKVTQENFISGVGAAIAFPSSAWLAHLIVHPQYRRKGIATRVVKHLVELLQSRKIHSISLLSTPEGESVYRKVGFRPIQDYIFFRRTKPAPASPIPSGIRPMHIQDLPRVINIDRQITGEDRSSLLQKHLDQAWVYSSGAGIDGFFLPDLVEGPILALTEAAGLALMELKYPQTDRAVVPADNAEALRFIRQNGFEETGLVEKRMILGPAFPWQPQLVYARTGGNLG